MAHGSRAVGLLIAAGSALAAGPASPHDLFLKPDRFFIAAEAVATLSLLNGSFDSSENAVARDRVADLSVLTPEGRTRPADFGWEARGPVTALSVRLGVPGTYVVGVSLRPRKLRLEGKDFNAYLEEEGLGDVVEARRRAGELGAAARERYSKHVKAVLQAGATPSASFDAPLGHPAEIVPLTNPATLAPGGSLEARCLVDGAPVAGLVVLTGGESLAGAVSPTRLVSDARGRVRFEVPHAGRYYLKFISMRRLAGADIDYESRWATLTFEVR